MLAFRSAITLQRTVLSSQIYSENKSQQSKRNFIKISRDIENRSVKLTWDRLPAKSDKFDDIKVDKNNIGQVCRYINRYRDRYFALFAASYFSSIPLTIINFDEYHGQAPLLYQALCVSNLLVTFYFHYKAEQFETTKIKFKEELYPDGKGLPDDFYDKIVENYGVSLIIHIISAFPAIALLVNAEISLITMLPLVSAVLYSSWAVKERKFYNNKFLQSIYKK